MKKRLALLLAALLAVGSLTACGGGNDSAAKVKVGLGATTSFSSSKSIGEEDHGNVRTDSNAQADITVATVMLDEEGKIIQCVMDVVQVKATIDATGAMTTDPATTFKTKKELGPDYNMKPASPIGKEWDEQANAFELWCVGKTADEVAAGIGADGYPADTTLVTGCTMHASAFSTAVARACENAAEAEGVTADDVLGLGMTAELSSYAAATAEEAGKVQAYVNYAAATKNAEGKITYVLIDSIQATSTWGADGVLTTDTTEPKTKYEKQFDYGMQVASSLEKGEWFQQIDAFKQFITGKTADEVAAIAVNDEGKPTDATLVTGCTMKIGAYKTCVGKALAE